MNRIAHTTRDNDSLILRDGLHSELILRDWHQSGNVEEGKVIRSIDWLIHVSRVNKYAISCDSSGADFGTRLPAQQDRGAINTLLIHSCGSGWRHWWAERKEGLA